MTQAESRACSTIMTDSDWSSSATAWPARGSSRSVIARGGRDAFDITMFGDEPYGNYNRILLSGVLAGSHDAEDIFINPARLVRARTA